MQTQIKKLDNLIWINIVKPELFEIKKILLENNLNDSLAGEIVNPNLNAKVDTLRNAFYLTLHFPITRNGITENEEIDFLIKNNLIISSTYNEIPFLKNHIENLNYDHGSHGGIYFVNFVRNFYENIEKELENILKDIKKIENEIFGIDERKIILDLTTTSKKIFDVRSKLKTHKEVLGVFANESSKIFGFEFANYPLILQNKYNELMSNLDNQKENIQDLKDTIDFLLTNKTNQIVKVFTVVSFVILPMTFLAGFFGMNTKFPSELVLSPFGTVYIMLIMFFISVCVLLYLHFKKLI